MLGLENSDPLPCAVSPLPTQPSPQLILSIFLKNRVKSMSTGSCICSMEDVCVLPPQVHVVARGQHEVLFFMLLFPRFMGRALLLGLQLAGLARLPG